VTIGIIIIIIILKAEMSKMCGNKKKKVVHESGKNASIKRILSY
jgi:hypothetical protein